MKGCSCHSLYSSSCLPLSNATHNTHLVISCQSRFPRNVNVAKSTTLSLNVENRLVKQQRRNDYGFGAVVGCIGNWSSVTEMEREVEAEMNNNTQEEDQDKCDTGNMERFRNKCGGEGKGVVEMLECLEKEAIMGEDVGKEPTDYNRRAHIFDTSSKVFQALRELDSQ